MAALQMVAQAPGRADHHVRARREIALLLARVHAADAAHHPRAGLGVEPGQFQAHLHRQLARRRHHQHHRRAGFAQAALLAKDGRGHGQAIGEHVLPEPVWAETSRSRSRAPRSSTAAWTGVGSS